MLKPFRAVDAHLYWGAYNRHAANYKALEPHSVVHQDNIASPVAFTGQGGKQRFLEGARGNSCLWGSLWHSTLTGHREPPTASDPAGVSGRRGCMEVLLMGPTPGPQDSGYRADTETGVVMDDC